jgi:hypothetical protein
LYDTDADIGPACKLPTHNLRKSHTDPNADSDSKCFAKRNAITYAFADSESITLGFGIAHGDRGPFTERFGDAMRRSGDIRRHGGWSDTRRDGWGADLQRGASGD